MIRHRGHTNLEPGELHQVLSAMLIKELRHLLEDIYSGWIRRMLDRGDHLNIEIAATRTLQCLCTIKTYSWKGCMCNKNKLKAKGGQRLKKIC